METIEYRVRPVTRYIVTRYHSEISGSAGVSTVGEYENGNVAYEVAYAMCREEHFRIGWLPGDERIQYPTIPDGVNVAPPITVRASV